MHEWIISYKKLAHSGAINQNFLFNNGKFFIMDNHRAAAWCWAQKLDFTKNYSLFHIDRHYDWGVCNLDNFRGDLRTMSIQDYLDAKLDLKDGLKNSLYPVFDWANSMPAFIKLFPETISKLFFATNYRGSRPPKKIDVCEVENEYLLSDFLDFSNNRRWIVNLDIDYFFADLSQNWEQILDDSYIKGVCEIIKKQMDKIEVITIALSPECCGGTANALGWRNSIRVAEMISGYFCLGFKIDQTLIQKD